MASSQLTQPTRIFQSAAAAENAYREQLARNETFNEQFEVMTTKLNSFTAKLDQLINLMLTQQSSTEPVSVCPLTDNVLPTSPVDLGLGPPRLSSDPTGIQLSSYSLYNVSSVTSWATSSVISVPVPTSGSSDFGLNLCTEIIPH